jgi:hypothetical protein
MKKAIAVQVLLVLFVISACSPSTVVETDQATRQPTVQIDQESKQPVVTHHAMPNLRVDTGWIKDAGCSLHQYSSGYYSGSCSSESPLLKLGCESIEVKDVLGGLPYPVVTCTNSSLMPLGEDYTQVGCYLSQRTEALLTFRDGIYQFVGVDEVKAMSVPIESPEEALSYVLAVTDDYYEMYDIEIESYYEYFVDEIEDTFVEQTQNGYLLHLFANLEPKCSCGDHYTDAVDVLVDRDGEIKEVESRHFYKFDGCVD